MKAIKLTNVQIGGFATQNMLPSEEGYILVRAKFNSNQPEFHLYMRGIDNLVVNAARAAGKELTLDHASTLLLLIHSDDTADLYLEPIPSIMEMLAKGPIKKGQIVYRRDIADLRRVRFQNVKIGSDDRIIYCFKVGWKFGLFFDLGQNRELDIEQMELDLAHLRRLLVYENEYEATSQTAVFDQLTQDGWFPFIEIIGGDFDDLLKAHKNQFAIKDKEAALVSKFNSARIDRIGNRWWNWSFLKDRRPILEPALEPFKEEKSVPCLKIILTEIEGIIRDRHVEEVGSRAKMQKLLDFAIAEAIKKTGTEASLFFPKQFLQYLRNYTFANFNPHSPKTDKASRHSISHGGAASEAYTLVRALQAILTLDQIGFFLSPIPESAQETEAPKPD